MSGQSADVANKQESNEVNNTKGSLIRHFYYSNSLENERFIDVYLPPGYDAEGESTFR